MSITERHELSTRRGMRGGALCVALLGLFLGGPVVAMADAPEIQEWHTDNGARVLFIEVPDIPLVNARLTFAAGAARDGDQPGVARLTADGLMSGTNDLDADGLAEAWERHGARVSTGSARDMAWLDMTSLSDADQLWPVVDVLAGMLASPAFAEAEVERLKDQHRTELRQQRQSPGHIASRLFWETAYEGHPYAVNPLGNEESLERIKPADLHAFHERYYVGANANLALVGDLDRAEAERLARELVGELPEGESAEALPPAPELDDDVTRRESFPSTQAHIIIGRPGVARGPDDSPALDVANHVFGAGSFTSRLFREVREERGLVYGVRSISTAMDVAGPFRIGLQTRGDQEQEALTVVRSELQRFLADGPTVEETEASVRNITGGFPLSIDANRKLVGHLGAIGFYDLPLDHLQTYPDRVAEVDAAEAHAAFLDAVGHRPRVTVVVGGDRARSGDDQ